MTKRPIVLLRCSTEHQDAEFTSQRASIEPYLAKYALVVAEDDWRREIGVSGAALIRPELDRIRQEAEAGAISTLICANFDRAGRSGFHTAAMVEDLVEDHGVHVVFVQEGLDLKKPLAFKDRAVMAALSIGGMAKLEMVSLSTSAAFGRNAAGVTVALASGLKVGNPSYRWEPEQDAALLALVRGKASPELIAATPELRLTVARGAKLSHPSAREMRRRLGELGFDARGRAIRPA